MTLLIRGVRDPLSTPARANLRHGGDTTCLEAGVAGERILVIDAGTGIRSLGTQIAACEGMVLSSP